MAIKHSLEENSKRKSASKTSKSFSIIDLAKQYGIETKNVSNTSVSEYLRKTGRPDLSKLYEIAQREIRGA